MNKKEIDILNVKEDIINENDENAAAFRKELTEKGVYLLNLMGSPGAGKTSTLLKTIEALKGEYRIGVMEADVDSDVDAKTISETGVKVIQLHTGGSCHMDSAMTKQGVEGLGIEDLDVVILENIGNLVCPAEFDVGAARKVTMLSVPEGDDKPLKYPLMFQVTDVLLINKIDAMPVFDFSMDKLKDNLKNLNKDISIFPISAATGEGVDEWTRWLKADIETWRKNK